jgi:hypothetical protein
LRSSRSCLAFDRNQQLAQDGGECLAFVDGEHGVEGAMLCLALFECPIDQRAALFGDGDAPGPPVVVVHLATDQPLLLQPVEHRRHRSGSQDGRMRQLGGIHRQGIAPPQRRQHLELARPHNGAGLRALQAGGEAHNPQQTSAVAKLSAWPALCPLHFQLVDEVHHVPLYQDI